MITYKQFYIAVAAVIAAIAVASLYNPSKAPNALGSTIRGGEYQATTTNSFTTATAPVERVLVTGSGTLGQVTITGANTGTINFYDATTSNVSARTGQGATSTILVASIPASAAAGTYVFDALVFNGLYIVTSGTAPTSTVMYRQ